MIQVSVCIPVYNMRLYLEDCLDSVVQAAKGLDSFEVIVVDDGSNIPCTDIIHKYIALKPISLVYVQHTENKGLLEARRTALKYAKGDYVLMLDCDDLLLPGALSKLYHSATTHSCDILQGAGEVRMLNKKMSNWRKISNTKFVCSTNNEYSELCDADILKGLMIKGLPTSYICNKLIKRTLYTEALNDIPEMYCVLNEDLLQMFYICKHCHKYGFINDTVVLRTLDTGLTNITGVISLERFKQLCSVGKAYECLLSQDKYTQQIKQRRTNSYATIMHTYNAHIADEDKPEALSLIHKYFTK